MMGPEGPILSHTTSNRSHTHPLCSLRKVPVLQSQAAEATAIIFNRAQALCRASADRLFPNAGQGHTLSILSRSHESDHRIATGLIAFAFFVPIVFTAFLDEPWLLTT